TAEATAGWYRYTITGAQTANVIFNNNSSPQTADLMAVTGEVWYDNGWVAKPAGFVRMADNAILADESEPTSYSVYPNPVSRSFFLQTNQKTDGDQWVRIFNSAGVEVYRQPVDLSETAVEIQRVPDIKAGLHFIQILDTEGKQVLHSSKIIFQ
ncbi:MAG TPA: starch-binding protein, partial [Catalimonadaceae bacterium]|nr:starch-binding protein [Catalimonadaceae bacterium]